MSRKPESKFIDRIHKKLSPSVYHQAMGAMYSNGTPDRYYEGFRDNLWVEYKWYAKRPDVIDLTRPVNKPKMTPLQRRWCTRASKNGQNVLVIVGFFGGAFVLGRPDQWNEEISTNGFKAYSYQELADLIRSEVE